MWGGISKWLLWQKDSRPLQRRPRCPLFAASGRCCVRNLLTGTKRFGELLRSVENVSQKVLIAQLRETEEDGLVDRQGLPGGATPCGIHVYRTGVKPINQKTQIIIFPTPTIHNVKQWCASGLSCTPYFTISRWMNKVLQFRQSIPAVGCS